MDLTKWKCGAHNLVLPNRTSCPKCAAAQRARLHAEGVAATEQPRRTWRVQFVGADWDICGANSVMRGECQHLEIDHSRCVCMACGMSKENAEGSDVRERAKRALDEMRSGWEARRGAEPMPAARGMERQGQAQYAAMLDQQAVAEHLGSALVMYQGELTTADDARRREKELDRAVKRLSALGEFARGAAPSESTPPIGDVVSWEVARADMQARPEARYRMHMNKHLYRVRDGAVMGSEDGEAPWKQTPGNHGLAYCRFVREA